MTLSCPKGLLTPAKLNPGGSKSESNRALIIQYLSNQPIEILNLSRAKDTEVLQKALTQPSTHIDIGPAGTAMRFLTAYLAQKPGAYVLTGSERMKQRPIGILVEALNSLGAKIDYLEKPGFPPLKINGKSIKGGSVHIDPTVSSQFISALCMVAPKFKEGMKLIFHDQPASEPYLLMTLELLKQFGISSSWKNLELTIPPQEFQGGTFQVETDWSSASYWYALLAIAGKGKFFIKGLQANSKQADSICAKLFRDYGIETRFTADGAELEVVNQGMNLPAEIDFSDCPDIAQTLAVVAVLKKQNLLLTGLKSLRIKETDRIQALINELEGIGARMYCPTPDSIQIEPAQLHPPTRAIRTYEDHRMAMAFAPLALVFDQVEILEPMVVEKSYPHFWEELERVGFIARF